MSEPVWASQVTNATGKIVSYYNTDGTNTSDPTQGDLLYQLQATAGSDGAITSGHPGRDNNPGDLAAIGANLDYSGLIGVDPPAPGTENADGTPAPGIVIFDDRQDGLAALYQHVNYAITNHSTEILADYMKHYSGGATDDVEQAGFNLQDTVGEALTSSTLIDSFVAAIVNGEGGETPVEATFFAANGLNVSIPNVVNLNVSNVTTLALSAGLDDVLDTKPINGQIVYTEDQTSKTVTFSSNIDVESGNAETLTLGTIDTDTFIHLGDGTTIDAGGTVGGKVYVLSSTEN